MNTIKIVPRFNIPQIESQNYLVCNRIQVEIYSVYKSSLDNPTDCFVKKHTTKKHL